MTGPPIVDRLSSMRTQLLESFRTKRITQNLFWPMLMLDFFDALPEYRQLFQAAGHEYVDTTPSIAERYRFFISPEGVRCRVAFGQRVGAAFLGWCQAHAVKSTVDPSVTFETHVDGPVTAYVTNTPVGHIVTRHKVSSVSHNSYVVERPLKTLDDLRVFHYVTEATHYEPYYDDAAAQQAVLGEAGLYTGGGFNCPFHQLLYLFEAEDLLMMSFDMPQQVRDTLDLLHTRNIEMVQAFAGSPFCVFDHDSIWDVRQISPAIYRQYYVPYQKDYNDIFHAAGKFTFEHASGQDLGPYLDAVESAGFDIIHGLHLDADNVDHLVETAKRWDGRIVPVVGPDPDYLRRAPADDIRRLCGKLRARLGDQNIIMGTSDSTVPGTPLANLLAESEAICGYTTCI